MATKIQKIIPHLWYDKEAIKAAEFYVSIFPDSKIISILNIHNTPSGSVDIITFELAGNTFMAINAGPLFKFNESISFMVYCDTQEEIDYYWEKLTCGGLEQPCGWLKDKFGLSWQIVPTVMDEMMLSTNKEKLTKVTQAMLKMVKFDIMELNKAYGIK